MHQSQHGPYDSNAILKKDSDSHNNNLSEFPAQDEVGKHGLLEMQESTFQDCLENNGEPNDKRVLGQRLMEFKMELEKKLEEFKRKCEELKNEYVTGNIAPNHSVVLRHLSMESRSLILEHKKYLDMIGAYVMREKILERGDLFIRISELEVKVKAPDLPIWFPNDLQQVWKRIEKLDTEEGINGEIGHRCHQVINSSSHWYTSIKKANGLSLLCSHLFRIVRIVRIKRLPLGPKL